jgi:hypothetical protein
VSGVKNRHLYKLIERIRRDEAEVDFDNEQAAQAFTAKHGLRHEEDFHVVAHLQSICEAWDQGIRPSGDDMDLVMEALRYAVLPRIRRKLPKPQQDKDREARIKDEARAYQKQLKASMPAPEAWTSTVIEMKRCYPTELANKSATALIDRWSRR